MNIPALCALCAALTMAAATTAEQPVVWPDTLAQGVAVEQLTEDQIAKLSEVVAAYQRAAHQPVTNSAPLQTTRLREILAELHVWEPSRHSPWQRFWQWLSNLLEEQRLEIDLNPAWLKALLQASTFEWVFRLCMVGFIVVATVVVANELRQTRWRQRRPRTNSVVPAATPTAYSALSWQDIAKLPVGERSGAVLRLVLASLNAAGAVFAGIGTTHRDIASAANRLDEGRGRRLRRLAGLAERVRFGGWRPDLEESERLVCLGREILATRQPANDDDTLPSTPATPLSERIGS